MRRRLLCPVLAATVAVVAFARADSLNVRFVGGCLTAGYAHNVALSESLAYVAASDSGLRVVDVSDPQAPFEIGHFSVGEEALDIQVKETLAYLTDVGGLHILNVSDPREPHEVGACDLPDPACGIFVSGNYAFVADASDGLRVVDVADPTQPHEIGHYNTRIEAWGIFVTGDLAWLSNAVLGLRVIDVSDPLTPHEVGFFDTRGWSWNSQVANGHAYMADNRGLSIINVTDPARPFETGYCYTTEARDVAILGSYACIADGVAGLRIIDVSDVGNPREVGFHDVPGYVEGVVTQGENIYAVAGGAGLGIYRFLGAGIGARANLGTRHSATQPTLLRGGLLLIGVDGANASGVLLDISGRRVMELQAGANDVRHLAPGVYFVRSGPSAASGERSAVCKVIIAK